MRERISVAWATSWIESLFPGQDVSYFSKAVLALEKISETSIPDDTVDLSTTARTDIYYDSEKRMWALDDFLLFAISRRIANLDDQALAIRLFLLHEAVHRGRQHLAAGQRLRRFPKVVEELDYQADVWAFLYELAMSRVGESDVADNVRSDLLRIIKTAINTFWAFDAFTDPSRMEIRRINRYLIWYWQRLEIEAKKDNDLSAILVVLANRPLVEVAGPAVRAADDRVYFLLDQLDNAEIGVAPGGRLFRFGHGYGSPVADILQGFRDRNDAKILAALKTIFEQVRDV